jgi:hypothetical protein
MTQGFIQSAYVVELIITLFGNIISAIKPIPVVERSKEMVSGCSRFGITGSNPAGGMDVCLLWVLCVVR